MREQGVTERAKGAKGVLTGVAVVKRVEEDFVRVEAGWYYFGIGAEARQYTLSKVGGRWVVDTQKLLWIS